LSTMDDVERSNKLPYAKSAERLEYLILGKFKRREDDETGVYGAFWVRYTKLLETFDKDELNKWLKGLEDDLAVVRGGKRQQQKKRAR